MTLLVQASAYAEKSCLLAAPITKNTFLKATDKNQPLTTIDADNITRHGDLTTLIGNVILKKVDHSIHANKAIINQKDGDKNAIFSGNVVYQDKTATIKGEKIEKNLNQDSAIVNKAFFVERDAKIRGYANKLEKKDKGLSFLTDAYFTSCPEDKEDWKLKSKHIELDYKSKQGKAKNIVMEYKDIPFFYSPFFYFPLSDDRLSGFLAPDFKNSSRNGFEFSIPYYFNIAPNIDTTLTPRFMSDAGLMLNNELRYLTPNSEWDLQTEFMHNDKISATQRSSARLIQSAQFDHFRMNTDISSASDKDFFDDFGNSLDTSNRSHLVQKIDFYTPAFDKDININFLKYQTLDESIVGTARPYQLLPRVSYQNSINKGSIEVPYQLQWSNFFREASTIGHRFYFKPEYSKKYQGAAWSVKPKISLDMTYYDLTTSTNQSQSFSRNLPILSVDSSIYLEKSISDDAMQLLESRFFYLYVPYQYQSDIPLFDTAKTSFNFSQIYRENQYSGFDRLQNANQLTSSISLKEIDLNTGREKYQIQAGIISYFDLPKVPLNNETLSTEKGSNILFQLDGHLPSKVNSQYFLEYDPKNNLLARQTAFIKYNNKKQILNLSWNKTQNTITTDEQTSLSAYWPITNNWQFIGRNDYSISKKEQILSLVGLEYDNCCFQFRLAYNRKPKVNSTEFSEETTFQIVFKSLSKPAIGIGKQWQEQVTGYHDPYQPL